MSGFGDRVLRAAEQVGIKNRSQIARAVGVDRSTFSRWLRQDGEPDVPVGVYFRLAGTLGVSIFDLLPPDLIQNDIAGAMLKRVLEPGEDVDPEKLLATLDGLEAKILEAQVELATLRRLVRGLVR